MDSSTSKSIKGRKLDLENQSLNTGLAFGNDHAALENNSEPQQDPGAVFEPSAQLEEQNIEQVVQEIDLQDMHRSSEYFTQNKDRPMVQLINLDLNFAKIGTVMMMLRTLISPFVTRDPDNHAVNSNNGWGLFDDALHKIRQVCQYSIPARPDHIARNPDDIGSDTVHNLEAVALGRRVYNLNAFLSPWLTLLKTFAPSSDSKILGLATRMTNSADQIIGKITNLFWNVRRVSMGLIPYDGGMKTEALAEKQNSVRDLMGYN